MSEDPIQRAIDKIVGQLPPPPLKEEGLRQLEEAVERYKPPKTPWYKPIIAPFEYLGLVPTKEGFEKAKGFRRGVAAGGISSAANIGLAIAGKKPMVAPGAPETTAEAIGQALGGFLGPYPVEELASQSDLGQMLTAAAFFYSPIRGAGVPLSMLRAKGVTPAKVVRPVDELVSAVEDVKAGKTIAPEIVERIKVALPEQGAKLENIIKTKAPPKPAAPEGIPTMITKDMESQLKALGVTEAEISKMTPQQVWEKLKALPAKPAAPEAPLPPGLKKPIESLSTEELEKRVVKATPYKKLYQAELDKRKGIIPPTEVAAPEKVTITESISEPKFYTLTVGDRKVPLWKETFATKKAALQAQKEIKEGTYFEKIAAEAKAGGAKPIAAPQPIESLAAEAATLQEKIYYTEILDSFGIKPISGGSPLLSEEAKRKLIQFVNEVKPARAETEILKHEELQKRVAKAAAILEKGEGEKAFLQAQAPLKGRLPRAAFAPPKEALSKEEIGALFDEIRLATKRVTMKKGEEVEMLLPFFTRLNTAKALQKLLIGEIPTGGELELLEEVFGSELVKAILSKRTVSQKVWAEVRDLLNIPRAILSSFDLSAPLRQGVVLAPGHPKEWLMNIGPMLKALASEKYYRNLESILKGRATYDLGEKAGLYLAPMGGRAVATAKLEEAFMSRFVRYIPGVYQSQRAYVAYLNKLRADVFDTIVKQWEGTSKTLKDYQGLARFINRATGRGSLGMLERSGDILAAGFFSPRLLAGRLTTPLSLFETAAVRKIVAKDLAAFVGTGVGILTLIKLAGGAEVEVDPRSSDFGKIKIGNTRIDFWGGYQPIARYTAQLIVNQRKTTGRGNIVGIDRGETLWRFIRSKLSPPVGLAIDIAEGKTAMGEELIATQATILRQAKERLVPLFIQDVTDAINDSGLSGGFIALPGVLGINVQTFGVHPLQGLAEKEGVAKGRTWADMEPIEHSPLEMSPEGRKELEKTSRGIWYDRIQVRWKFYDAQEERDKRFRNTLVGNLQPGELPLMANQWRDLYYSESAIRSAILDEISEDYNIIKRNPRNAGEVALSEYFDLQVKFLDTKTQQFDSEGWRKAKQDYMASLQPEIRDYVDDNSKIDTTPLVQEFISASKLIQPYWDIEDEVAKFNPDGAKIAEMLRTETNTQYRSALMAMPTYKQYDRAKTTFRESLRKTQSELDATLKYWWYPTLKLLTPEAERIYQEMRRK